MTRGALTYALTKVLTENPKAREDDFLMVYLTYCELRPEVADYKFVDIVTMHKELGLPSFEGVTRRRREIQAKNPELQGDSKTILARKKEEEEYHKEYKK